MRLVLIFCLLALAVNSAVVDQDRWGNDGSTGFDLDWFWIGSNLRSIGKYHGKLLYTVIQLIVDGQHMFNLLNIPCYLCHRKTEVQDQ